MKQFHQFVQSTIFSMKSLDERFCSNNRVLNLALAFIVSSIFLTNIVHTQTSIYIATLNGAAENPPNASLGTGTATITIDATLNTMKVVCDFSGLSGTVTASHIHAATAAANAGTAGVASQTPTFTGFPSGVTSGTYDNTFDMTLASSYNATFITNNGGTASSAFTALKTAIADGKAYLNIHSSAFGGGEIRGFLTLSSLPIELVDFTVNRTEKGNRLYWYTASENNNKGFQIERSKLTDDKWEILGFVKAKGEAASYNFWDITPFSTSYYRLRQIDIDGSESLSKIVSIFAKGDKKLKIFPNPVSNVLTVETEENSVVHILNFLGQEVLSSNNTQRFDVSFLPRGTYIIKAGEELSRFVKQ
jgi:CHRD domain/Secretion system C-terminal sorting domain